VAALTDEILMAYADGALDAEAAARVEALVRGDARAQARVLMFKATGRELSSLYDGVLNEPVPAPLTRFVMAYGKERESPALLRLASQNSGLAASLPPRRERFGRLWAERVARAVPAGAGWHMAAAAGVALIVGTGAGFWLRGGQDGASGPSLAALRQGPVLASGTLHQVLETVPSGKDGRTADNSTPGSMAVRAVLTFKAKGGGYCREYEIAAGQGLFQGLACRQPGGQWAVEAHVALAAQASGKGVPAAQSEALDKLADSRIDGDALSGSQEKAAIKNGWK
jgi:anti-sigma factor RsiW